MVLLSIIVLVLRITNSILETTDKFYEPLLLVLVNVSPRNSPPSILLFAPASIVDP